MPLFSQHRVQRVEPADIRAPRAAGAAATQLLRRYRPLETRATGGFGSVEICLDSRLLRRVAIKRMPLAGTTGSPSTASTPAALAEARTASLLTHPNIVPVIDFTYDAAAAYLVMEYVDGMNLEEFLAAVEGHSLTYDEAAYIADALAQALTFAHDNGVLHLDIKPANVLIDRNGNVKLADFGMATLTSAAGFGGARGGTLGYMPPEQVLGERVDRRTDTFSLAAVLYEGLCDMRPFVAETPAESLNLIEQGVIAPSEFLPGVPDACEKALLQALAYDADERQATVSEFADDFLEGLGDARAGRRSLATLIATLTADDADTQATTVIEKPERTPVETDPEKGWLGSRHGRAREIARGALAGVSVFTVSLALLGCAGTATWGRSVRDFTELAASLGPQAPLWIFGAAALGLAAGAAPQLGSALVLAGLTATALLSTNLIAGAPAVVGLAALSCGWWLTWGREQPGASAALVAALAAAALTGSPVAAAIPLAALTGALATPLAAASTVALSTLAGACLIAAQATGGALPLDALAAALADPGLWLRLAGCAALAAATSALLTIAWRRWRDSSSNALFFAAAACPLVLGTAVGALAYPMEIAAPDPLTIVGAAGMGALSSILLNIYVYLFGYEKAPTEGDRP